MSNINKQALRSKARSASAGEWIKESGDGWEAICSTNDQANGNFIIAHFEGPDAKANREFAQAAHPDVVLALLDEISELEHQHCGTALLEREEAHAKTVGRLMDELEAAEKSNEFLKGQLAELANFNPDWDKLEASYESWREIAAELLVAKDRITELEARELVVNLPAYVDGRTLGYGEVNHMIDLCADAIEKAGHAAGIITKVGE